MNPITRNATALLLLATTALAQDPCGTWGVVPVPAPPASSHAVLLDVASVSTSDAWAVGRRMIGNEARTLAYRWNGSTWSIVPTPSPVPQHGSGWAELLAVAVVSGNDVWAAGSQRIHAPDQFVGTHILVERWNGSTWSVVPAPVTVGGSGNFVDDIEVVAPDEVWFVGDWLTFPPASAAQKRALAMRWNGSGFQVFDTPFFDNIDGHGLTSVSAVASDDVWAVGGGHDGDYVAFSYIVHWNGSQWEHRPGPTPGAFHRLYAVEAVSTDDVWAVGDYLDDSGYHGLAMHWNGSTWTRLPDPPVGGSSLAVLPGGEVYVGGGGVARWNGSGWTTVATFPDVGGPSILSLAPIGPCSLWGVGRQLANGEIRPLTVRLDGAPVPSAYCSPAPNSAGAGAHMGFTGSTSIAAHDFVLRAQGCPPNTAGRFYLGTSQAFAPFGNGFRCAGGQILRLPILNADASGNSVQAFSFPPGVVPGSTWNFQFWFRDVAAGGAHFNLSNGLQAHFVP